MRFVEKWSFACAKHMASVTNENHQRRAIYYYAFYIIIGALVKGVILMSAALILRVFWETLAIVLVFGSLRMFAGGYHMDTYNRCLFVSMALFILAALIARHTFTFWGFTGLAILILITAISGIYVLIKYAPKDTPNKPITDPAQIKKLKKMSLIYLSVLLTAIIILVIFNINVYVISFCFAILLELFSVTPAGHKFFDMIKKLFIIQKKENLAH